MVSALQRHEKLDEALNVFQEQIKNQFDRQWGWIKLDLSLQTRGNLDNAFTAFQKQVEIIPDHEWALNCNG